MTKPSKILPRSVKLYLTLLTISTGLIIYGTLFPTDYDVPHGLIGMDKLVHVVMFATWSFFYGLVRFLKDKYKLLPVFLVSTFFGLLIEVFQYFLPTGRSAELMDLIADSTGTGIALVLLYLLSRKIPEFQPEPSSE
ncbi:VanZ family protein [Gracilimonas tropica]|uniref:VanZ family protein n=1 Tax=Gracilimonas tropica TaxID=454600 RepID=UPI0003812E15|nr:VanZ family protein [Gracilimonas tropica]